MLTCMRFSAILVAIALLGGCTAETGSRGPATRTTGPPKPEHNAGATPGGARLSPVEGGSIFVAADEPPVTLNAALADGNAVINAFIYAAVLSPLWRITADLEYEPLLLEGEPEVTNEPFTVTYTLKDGLVWNDGWPLTAKDVAFTHDTIMNRRFDIATRRGHKLVRWVRVLDRHRVQFVFDRPYGDWRAMFSQPEEAILPKHILRKSDFDAVWTKELTASSGPFEFDSWESGQLTLKRNEGYWGDAPSLDEVVIAFYPDIASKVRALQEGEVDVLYAPGQTGLLDHLQSLGGVTVEVGPSTLWEHIDFNTQLAPLDKQFVRQAVAKAIDRQRIVETAAAPLDPDATVLNSVLALGNQPGYRDTWSAAVAFDPAAAEELLVRNKCRKVDGTYRCQGTALEVDFVTTAASPLRLQVLKLVREDLAAVGITLNSRTAPSRRIFTPSFLASKKRWGMFEFATRGGESMAATQMPWRCTSPPWINITKYCNPAVDELLDRANHSAAGEEAAELLAQADRLIAQDVPTLPLYQRPSYLVWRSSIDGPRHNASAWGPLWNVGDWVLMQ